MGNRTNSRRDWHPMVAYSGSNQYRSAWYPHASDHPRHARDRKASTYSTQDDFPAECNESSSKEGRQDRRREDSVGAEGRYYKRKCQSSTCTRKRRTEHDHFLCCLFWGSTDRHGGGQPLRPRRSFMVREFERTRSYLGCCVSAFYDVDRQSKQSIPIIEHY